jgi:hypothetical protein
METEYQEKEKILKEEYRINLNLHIPQWARTLVELYTSPLKYKIKYESLD